MQKRIDAAEVQTLAMSMAERRMMVYVMTSRWVWDIQRMRLW